MVCAARLGLVVTCLILFGWFVCFLCSCFDCGGVLVCGLVCGFGFEYSWIWGWYGLYCGEFCGWCLYCGLRLGLFGGYFCCGLVY